MGLQLTTKGWHHLNLSIFNLRFGYSLMRKRKLLASIVTCSDRLFLISEEVVLLCSSECYQCGETSLTFCSWVVVIFVPLFENVQNVAWTLKTSTFCADILFVPKTMFLFLKENLPLNSNTILLTDLQPGCMRDQKPTKMASGLKY